MNHSVPLPRKNSITASNMRCALILAYLVRMLDQEIFQPNYIVHDEIDVRGVLLREAVRNSRKESFRRAFLLAVCPEEQSQILQKRAANVVGEVMRLVHGLIETDQVAALQSDLQDFTRSACTVWRAVQRLEERFEPNLEFAVDTGIDWQKLQMHGEEHLNAAEAPATSAAADEVVLVIFPRVYIAKDAPPQPVTPGVVLRKSQTIAAERELRTEDPPSPTFGREYQSWSRADRVRRESMAMNGPLANRNITSFLAQGLGNGKSD